MKIRSKILLLLTVIALLFGGVVGFDLYFGKEQIEKLSRDREMIYRDQFEKLIELKGMAVKLLVDDYTFWDEMVDFVAHPDEQWAHDNLVLSLGTFRANALWVFDSDFSLVYSTNSFDDNALHGLPVDKNRIVPIIRRNRFHHFFISTHRGLVEIRGASIHPTIDVDRRTPPKGYLFVGVLWSEAYLEELSRWMDGIVSLDWVMAPDTVKVPSYSESGLVHFHHTLKAYAGEPLMSVSVSIKSPILIEMNRIFKRQIYLAVIFALFLVGVTSFLLIRWINRPLDVISQALGEENPSVLGAMAASPSEFGKVAELIRNFFVQREGLIRENKERKIAEEALATEKERLDVTLKSIGEGVVTVDFEDRILFMNRQAEEFTGWEQDEASGKKIGEVFRLLREKSRRQIDNPIEEARYVQALSAITGDTILMDKSGNERPITFMGSPLRGIDGQVIGNVIVFQDVTIRRRLEEEILRSQRMESIGHLAGGIAHDFNNLLTVVLSDLSLLKADLSDSRELSGIISEAEKTALRARDLTLQLLTFSRGGAPLKKSASVEGIIRETANFVLSGSNVRSEFQSSPDLWPIDADPGQISRVINNIILNAMQAMPNGGVINIRASNSNIPDEKGTLESPPPLPAGRYVRITIQDTGTGIPREHLSRIFTPYFTTKEKGTGLGLAATYSIIRRHDGHITFQSEVNKGTTFTIYLPASEAVPEKPPAEPMTPEKGRGRILVMDDEEMILSVLRRMLKRLGYDCVMASDGEEAVACYQEAMQDGHRFDLVILDLTIPGGTGGKETIRKLKAMDPNVVAIVSSGYSDDTIMAQYQRFGFQGVIAKPYDMERLGAVLQELIT